MSGYRGGSAGAASSIYRFPVKVSGSELSGQTLSDTGTASSNAFNPGGATAIGLALKVTGVTGTTPTVTPKLQWSPNGDATSPDWYSLPQSANSQTQATMAAITSASNVFEWYEVPVPEGNGRVRVQLDHSGQSANGGVTFGDSYWITKLI